MARPTKKAISKAQEASKALDRIFAEVDPNLIIAGFLGGTAAAGGLVPPLTRLLSIVNTAGSSQDYQRLFEIGNVFAYGPGGLIPGLFRLYLGEQERAGGPAPGEQESIAQYALFCSGALEGMLMYNAMKNPEVLKGIIGMPAEILKGIGEIVPG